MGPRLDGPSASSSAATSAATAAAGEPASLGPSTVPEVDSLILVIQGDLEAAAGASTADMEVDASWPPVVNVCLLVGTTSPSFGITPPTFEGCCDWSNSTTS